MKSGAAPVRFALRFLVGFAILMGGFEASRGTAFERFLVEELVIRPTAVLINWATPADQVRVLDRTIVSVGSSLYITRGCEGVEILALLVAAICAYPASRRQRTIGLLVGTVVVDLLSVGRLAVLHYTLKYYPGSWEAMHGLVAPLVPVVLLGLYFSRWLAWVSAEGPAAGAPGAA